MLNTVSLRFTSSFIIVFAALVTASRSEAAGPGEGKVLVQVQGETTLVYLEENAARALYDALDVKAYRPPYSPSRVKEISGEVECSKTEKTYDCTIGVENAPEGPSPTDPRAIRGGMDGGGSRNTTEGEGVATVNETGDALSVNVRGAAAEVLYLGLRVEGVRGGHFPSVVKDVRNVECIRQGRKDRIYTCRIKVDRR